MTPEAEQALGLLNSVQGAVLRRVETSMGVVAQVLHQGNGLLIVPVTVIDELLEAGLVEEGTQPAIHVIVRDGQKVAVPPDAQLFDSMEQPVAIEPDKSAVEVKAAKKRGSQ